MRSGTARTAACTGGTPLLVDRTATGPNRDADGRAGNRFSYDARWVTNENKSSARESLYCKHRNTETAVAGHVLTRKWSVADTARLGRSAGHRHGATVPGSSTAHLSTHWALCAWWWCAALAAAARTRRDCQFRVTLPSGAAVTCTLCYTRVAARCICSRRAELPCAAPNLRLQDVTRPRASS